MRTGSPKLPTVPFSALLRTYLERAVLKNRKFKHSLTMVGEDDVNPIHANPAYTV